MKLQMTLPDNNENSFGLSLERFLGVISAAGSFFMLWWVLSYSAYGIDVTDESFYLTWMHNPSAYAASITQFGFIYHPLYVLVGGDIATLRQANILITYTFAWTLAYFFLKPFGYETQKASFSLVTATAGLATSALIIFNAWLVTPSYNSLNLQALIVLSLGLVLSEKTTNRKSILGWSLICVGGWLAFMAKPSTAIGAAAVTFIYLLLARKLYLRLVLFSALGLAVLLLISAYAIDGSALDFISRYKQALEIDLGSGHSFRQIFRVDEFILTEHLSNAIYIASGFLFVTLFFLTTKRAFLLASGTLLSVVLFILIVFFASEKKISDGDFGIFKGLLLFSIPIAISVFALVRSRLKILLELSLLEWASLLVLLATPHLYAFGTNNNYWQIGSAAGFFWVLACLVLLGPLIRRQKSWILLLPIALMTQAITAALLQTGFEEPYRQPQPLKLNRSEIEVGPHRSKLLLSEGFADYFTKATATAKRAGLIVGSPMIDLTGQSPGILYVLEAESLGLPWIIGGYPNSLNYAKAALDRVPCSKIANAWLLLEPEGPRSISTDLMQQLGVNFPATYEHVGNWKTAEGAGGYTDIRTQELYKPSSPMDIQRSCELNRREVKN